MKLFYNWLVFLTLASISVIKDPVFWGFGAISVCMSAFKFFWRVLDHVLLGQDFHWQKTIERKKKGVGGWGMGAKWPRFCKNLRTSLCVCVCWGGGGARRLLKPVGMQVFER